MHAQLPGLQWRLHAIDKATLIHHTHALRVVGGTLGIPLLLSRASGVDSSVIGKCQVTFDKFCRVLWSLKSDRELNGPSLGSLLHKENVIRGEFCSKALGVYGFPGLMSETDHRSPLHDTSLLISSEFK